MSALTRQIMVCIDWHLGAHGAGETPVLIPNTEVKPSSGDYTAKSGKLARCRIIKKTSEQEVFFLLSKILAQLQYYNHALRGTKLMNKHLIFSPRCATIREIVMTLKKGKVKMSEHNKSKITQTQERTRPVNEWDAFYESGPKQGLSSQRMAGLPNDLVTQVVAENENATIDKNVAIDHRQGDLSTPQEVSRYVSAGHVYRGQLIGAAQFFNEHGMSTRDIAYLIKNPRALQIVKDAILGRYS